MKIVEIKKLKHIGTLCFNRVQFIDWMGAYHTRICITDTNSGQSYYFNTGNPIKARLGKSILDFIRIGTESLNDFDCIED